jgi:hypothetical protein
MKTLWTKGLDKDAKKDIESYFKGSVLLRKRLKEILEEKSDARERENLNVEGYETANWAFKQADALGYKRAMKEVISILTD